MPKAPSPETQLRNLKAEYARDRRRWEHEKRALADEHARVLRRCREVEAQCDALTKDNWRLETIAALARQLAGVESP